MLRCRNAVALTKLMSVSQRHFVKYPSAFVRKLSGSKQGILLQDPYDELPRLPIPMGDRAESLNGIQNIFRKTVVEVGPLEDFMIPEAASAYVHQNVAPDLATILPDCESEEALAYIMYEVSLALFQHGRAPGAGNAIEYRYEGGLADIPCIKPEQGLSNSGLLDEEDEDRQFISRPIEQVIFDSDQENAKIRCVVLLKREIPDDETVDVFTSYGSLFGELFAAAHFNTRLDPKYTADVWGAVTSGYNMSFCRLRQNADNTYTLAIDPTVFPYIDDPSETCGLEVLYNAFFPVDNNAEAGPTSDRPSSEEESYMVFKKWPKVGNAPDYTSSAATQAAVTGKLKEALKD